MTTQQQQRPQPVFDKEDQLNKITANLLQGEVVIAVYDCIGGGTGFVGITDRRVIIQDNSFVGKKVALTSVPYSKINSVSFVSDKSMWGNWASSSSIAISVSGREYFVDFRGEQKAKHVHDVVLWHVMR
jgi:Bacterial PH domain